MPTATLEATVRQRQKTFFARMINERNAMTDDPLMFALALSQENKVMREYIRDLLAADDILTQDVTSRKQSVRESTQSKSIAYVGINPELSVHPMYLEDVDGDDGLRIGCTRLRVSSHRLRIETGRWARIAREDRLCPCGDAVQDEKHAIAECTLVNEIREKYGRGIIDFTSFMNLKHNKSDLSMLSEIISFFDEHN